MKKFILVCKYGALITFLAALVAFYFEAVIVFSIDTLDTMQSSFMTVNLTDILGFICVGFVLMWVNILLNTEERELK